MRADRGAESKRAQPPPTAVAQYGAYVDNYQCKCTPTPYTASVQGQEHCDIAQSYLSGTSARKFAHCSAGFAVWWFGSTCCDNGSRDHF